MLNVLNMYSANTYLAYSINERYYKQHYVWCSPVYDPETLDKLNPLSKIPKSSSPSSIIKRFKEDIESSDLHSSLIQNNRTGIIKGAGIKLKSNIISSTDYARIIYKVENCVLSEFRPLLYIVPYDLVKNRLIQVPVNKTANPLSVEYTLEDLKSKEFEIIEI